MKRSARAAIAQETVEISRRGSYALPDGRTVTLAALVQRCLAGTQFLSPEELSRIRDEVLQHPPRYSSMLLEVHNETTLHGIARLSDEGGCQTIAVLNFASAKNPGGGFLGGSQAQEESLARSSALFASLSMPSAAEYYEFHRQSPSSLYSDRMILSPSCPVFRDDSGSLLERPYVVTFITSAAPNVGAIAQKGGDELTLVPATLRRRAELVLALAAHAGCDGLILGAWGCGVFRNDPRTVAEIFAELLLEGRPWHGRFARIRFSVLDTSDEQATYAAFRDVLGMADE
jgi:uncharacterized protein (TIGR02452 family)